MMTSYFPITFDECRRICLQTPHSKKSEKLSRKCIAKLLVNKFTTTNYTFSILWQTRKISSFFNFKDKNNNPSYL